MSAVKTIFSLSPFNSASALHSSLRLGLVGCAFLSNPFISAPNSSASWLLSFWQAVYITVVKSKLGGFLGTMAQFRDLDNKDSWAWVRGVLDKFITHLLSLLFGACDWLLLSIDCALASLPLLLPLSLLLANLLNLFTCLSLTLLNPVSLTLFINSVHLSIVVVVVVVTIDNSLDLHISNLAPFLHRMPLMHLILLWSNCFSALCVISLGLLLLLLLVDLSLTLPGIKSLPMHLSVNLMIFVVTIPNNQLLPPLQ